MAARTLSLGELPGLLGNMEKVARKTVSIGIANPEMAAVARLLEYGSIAGQKPWPRSGEKTVLVQGPTTGAAVVVSAQAPRGFIRITAPEILRELATGIGHVSDWLDPEEINRRSQAAVAEAAKSGLDRLRQLVPHDSGQLRNSLEVLDG